MSQKRAFTLIEIIVVVAILSIISVYIGISFSAIPARELESQARKLISDLYRTREMSVTMRQDFIVDFDVANKNYTIYKDSIAPANFLELKHLNIDSISITPQPENISFSYPRGTTQTKSITLNHKGKIERIAIFSSTGYITWD